MSRPAYSTSVLVDASSSEAGTETLFKTITVNTIAVDVMVNASPLAGRTSIMIQADEDNTGSVYLGVNTAPTTSNAMYRLSGGAGVVISLDKFNTVPVKAIGSVAGQKIHISEIK